MDDRYNERLNARQPDCEAVPSEVSLAFVRRVRTVVKCDPLPEPLPLPKFTSPAIADPARTRPAPKPNPLALTNEEVTAYCANFEELGPLGEDVTLAAGTFVEYVRFEDIPLVSTPHMQLLAALDNAGRQLLITSTIPQLVELTYLPLAQASWLHDAIRQAQHSVEILSALWFAEQLNCYWENEEQTVACAEDSVESDVEVPAGITIVNPVVVPSGVYRSNVSQEDANSLAIAAGRNQLRCLFGNDEIELTCLDLGYESAVPTDTESPSAEMPPRVGSVTVPANTVFNAYSKNQANADATALGSSQLVCYYVNTELELSCADLDFEDVADLGEADPATGAQGSYVTIPAGWIVSYLSEADADTLAAELARALLLCEWHNEELTLSCPTETVTIGDEEYEIEASVASPVRTITIAAGMFVSAISQEDADAQAAAAAELQLSCIYCNAEIAPVCYPDTIETPVPVPIPIVLVDTDWSTSATLGVAANTFCAATASEAQSLADTVNRIPALSQISTGEGCTYENDEQLVQCPNLTGLSPQAVPRSGNFLSVAAGTFSIRDVNVPEEWAPELGLAERAKSYVNKLALDLAESMRDCFYDNDGRTVSCTPATSSPGTVSPVVAFAGMFRSYVSKADANIQRDTYLSNTLKCVYANTATSCNCGSDVANGPNAVHSFSVAAGMFQTNTNLTEANNLATAYCNSQLYCNYEESASATCASGTSNGGPGAKLSATAKGYGSSKSAASAAASAAAQAQLNCVYTNSSGGSGGACPEGTTKLQTGSVPAGSVTASSPSAANSLAQSLADAANVCVPPDVLSGSPGNDGAQTGCSGSCIGVFS